MIPRVLACGLTQCGGHILTGEGWLVMIMFWGTVAATAGFLREQAVKRRKRLGLPPKPPREPVTDFPPALYELASGQRRARYHAPVRATTPGGISVRVPRCCPYGHQSPAQAVACAQRVKNRIERTGR